MRTRIKPIVIFIIISISVLMIASCGGEDNGALPPGYILASMDILNATNLFITKNSGSQTLTLSNGKLSNETQKLFKITDDGYIKEVKYYDEDENEIKLQYQPSVIYYVNDEYIIVMFGLSPMYPDSGYLVRKSDGAVYSLENAGYPTANDYFRNSSPISTDSSDNIYYLSYTSESFQMREIVKLNTQNLDNITKESYSPMTDLVRVFQVDSRGNAIYRGNLETNDGISVFRIKKANGALNNLRQQHLMNEWFWLGLDDNFYFSTVNWGDFYVPTVIKKVVIDSSYNVTISDYGPSLFSSTPPSCFKIELQGRMIVVDNNSSPLLIVEVHNPTMTPRVITLTGITIDIFQFIANSPNYYYILGKDESNQSVLVKVDPTDDSYTYLITTSEYDIYKMSVSDNEEITFNALRMADGAIIIGKIDSVGQLEIIDETLNMEIIVLERIN